ncbi:uracil-DNA glycosylase family protein [Marinomonas sp. C2222]|uniref:Uracil-DNA glycosylase family protein n=1 Tax=Marinomonas sargassi TaxID=2984494 RepID=A0ABT2YRE3_9GAMM|nr:uracil-DNA glycosylase family protein [Marinomonas sargassi]MCV2402463.1 uracil-DNA glycosylase family protein [Marinomonas sargassi]
MVEEQYIKVHEASALLDKVHNCSLCANLPFDPKPILQFNPEAKILIAGQAPGQITHHKGIPFDDPSGDRLRDWMGLSREEFYDDKKVAILPMAFCYPGTGKSGDLAPPAQCAAEWRASLLSVLPNVRLTLVIGQYAIAWHLKEEASSTLTETVKQWRTGWPTRLVMPHPSPRNNRWLKNNSWFALEVLPELKKQVKLLL